MTREAAIRILGQYDVNFHWTDGEPIPAAEIAAAVGMAIEAIKSLDSVEAVEVVHGRWIYEHKDPGMLPCSVCGYKVMRYNNTPYCPKCGAKMDGERKDDDAAD